MSRRKKGNDNDLYFTWDYLLSQVDRNGNIPSIFIAASRVRGPGKTYSMITQILNAFMGIECALSKLIGEGKKFCLMCRNVSEVGNIAEGMMHAVLQDQWADTTVEEIKHMQGAFSEIIWKHGKGENMETYSVGYVVPLNSSVKIKRISSMFADVGCIFFDEFVSEDGVYVGKEITKFQSIQNSMARGSSKDTDGGKHVRYLPVMMACNCIDVTNPYYVEFGLISQLQDNTKLYKGDYLVYQRCDNINAAKRQRESGFNQAFKRSNYAGEQGYLAQNNLGVRNKPSDDWGEGEYSATLINSDEKFGVWYFPESGIVYVTHSVDMTGRFKYSLTADGMPNTEFIKRSSYFQGLRDAFCEGRMRFKSAKCKQIIADIM